MLCPIQVLAASLSQLTKYDPKPTVKLRMVGALADYAAAKLDSIKADLAQMLRIRPDMLSLSAEAAVLPATGVDVSATMPDAAAADFMADGSRAQYRPPPQWAMSWHE
jgi:hypothetical protein